MANLVTQNFWQGRRVLLTGHTGFKGSWLALWLQQLGAEVTGFALAPATTPALFEIAKVGQGMHSIIADIRNPDLLKQTLDTAQPEIVLHLAAQALVGEGYRDPLGTYATNVMGTANLLEAVRHSSTVVAVVIVTSDKCYENREWPWPYRENEALGGHDPYSSSKACAELVTASYRNAFLREKQIPVATARAGNVFGGGDWSPNRLIPDILYAFSQGKPASLRRPQAVRPWQHVLEPLYGYLALAERIAQDPTFGAAWNFGPGEGDCITVGALADKLASLWGNGACCDVVEEAFPHEAGLLRLDASLAAQKLGWHAHWTLDQALDATVAWHRAWLNSADMRAITLKQITTYAQHHA